MSSIARSLAALLVVALLGSISSAQEMAENPQYKAWARFKPGTYVVVSHEVRMDGVEKGQPLRIRSKLVAVTAEQVVLEASRVDAEGNPASDEGLAPSEMKIPARVKKQAVTQPWLMPPEAGEKKVLPDQEVAIGGRSYKCRVCKYSFEQNGSRFDATFWTCADIPGEVVKLEQHISGGHDGTTKMEMMQVAVKP